LGEAQALAKKNLEQLHTWAARDVPIVASEPSCLAMLIDEYRELVPGEMAERVAKNSSLIDSHLVRAGVKLPLRAHGAKMLLHGHCHQKALVGTAETKAALAMVPGAEVQLVDSGCCGMAGSFGYEHYELSMKIGGRVLFPAVRSHPEAQIVAPGFSCRHQIAHGTGRHALHPIEVLAEHLELPEGDESQ
jgi:Fe-S oxidoreductase